MILVTGGTGHIGNVLIRKLLEQGEKVRALIWRDEDTTPIKDLGIEQVEGDVLDSDSLQVAMRGVDSVYHLAGIISIMPGKNPFVWKVNVDGTRNVVEAACRARVRRLVYTSSIHAIAHAPDGVAMDESLGFDQETPYGEYDRSKAAASLAVQQAAAEGLDAVIVCPTGVIGPYDFRGSELGEVIRSASEARTMFFVEGAYDFVDVRDVADGMIAAQARGRRGESYILGGNKISVRYMLETVREVTGKAFSSIKIPFSLAEFAARFTPWYYQRTRSKPRFTPYSLEVLQSNSNISHAKASRELGFIPRPSIETIADTVRWFFENRKVRGEA
ncbi:MAG: SDR family oxidoreductase [Anaerolineales bacterium]|jgi:dihydroflavonol-4-reductase